MYFSSGDSKVEFQYRDKGCSEQNLNKQLADGAIPSVFTVFSLDAAILSFARVDLPFGRLYPSKGKSGFAKRTTRSVMGARRVCWGYLLQVFRVFRFRRVRRRVHLLYFFLFFYNLSLSRLPLQKEFILKSRSLSASFFNFSFFPSLPTFILFPLSWDFPSFRLYPLFCYLVSLSLATRKSQQRTHLHNPVLLVPSSLPLFLTHHHRRSVVASFYPPTI